MPDIQPKFSLDLAPLQEGCYILAVSGGVDSMVLLDILRRQPRLKLIIAHVNHGTRVDNVADYDLVREVAMSHKLDLEYAELKLGENVSEEKARRERYAFLHQCRKKFQARAIITAHHQDDLLETALINLYRGTGRKGLDALSSTVDIRRPLLDVSKAEIINYAQTNNIIWRDDSTNLDQRYLRNFLRAKLKANPELRASLYQIIVRHKKLNYLINSYLNNWISTHVIFKNNQATIPRHDLIMLPSKIALEIIQEVLVNCSGKTMLRPQAARALLFIKTARCGKIFLINKRWQIVILDSGVIVERRQSVLS